MRGRIGLAAIVTFAALAACGKPSSQPQPLAPVAALPAPAVPNWIAQIAPLGTVKDRAQIRVIFASPVVPVEQLGSAKELQVLSHFKIEPSLPGGFVVLTPRMIGFQSDNPLPAAARVRVTLSAGLRDLKGDVLDRDLAWTFDTGPLALRVPQEDASPGTVSLNPVLHLRANAPVDTGSLERHASFLASGGGSVGATATRESPQPGDDTIVYDVTPKSALSRATKYELRIDAGVKPAYGNLASVVPLSLSMQTYSPLAFATAQPTSDPMTSIGAARFARGDPALVFNNALDSKTYAQHVKVTPAIGGAGQPYSLSDDGNAILVNPYALAPNTAYTFSFDGNLQDVYGQRLGQQVQATYRTGNYAAYFWAPSGTNRFITTQGLQLQYNAVNLPGNRYRARYVVFDPARMADTDEYGISDALGSEGGWPTYAVPNAAQNKPVTIPVNLAQKLGAPTGVLGYGAAGDTAGQSVFTGIVQLTNLGVFAQWFPQSGTVMVQHLSDGTPVANASVDVYASNVNASPPVPARLCASGSTDANGALTIAGNDIERCYMGDRPANQAPELYVAARSGRDWAYVRTYDWSGVYQYGTNIGDTTWSSGQPISYGTIYSDRDMYQPGERGWFTAVCYVLQNGTLHGDRNATYRVTLRDPNGNESPLPAQTTNRYATFSFPIDVKKTQALGYYTIVAKSPGGAEITGSFRVAEFRPPNFSVDLKLDRQFAAAGETLQAQGSAQYLFGAPMSGATATLHVTRQQTVLSPKGWDDFTFGRQWFWPEQQPDVDSDAGQQQITLDAKGQGAAPVTVAADLPYAMTYSVDLEVSDVSNLSSSATQSFTAVPSTTLIGLRSDFVGTVDTPISTAVIATDPSGKTLPGTRVHLELQKMEYSGNTQIVEGSESANNQVKYTTVAQADVTTGEQPENVSMTPKDPGNYRIRANLAGASSDATATDAQVWVTGPGQAAWGQQNPSQLQLKLDKQTYRTGDVATVAVASPYDKADLYLSVVRDRVLYKTIVHVNGSAPKVRIPVSQDMFPNAAVEGILVRRGAPISNKSVAPVDSLVRIGMVPLTLDVKGQYLTAKIVPAQSRIAPHAAQRVRLQLRDSQGKPVQGQFTVAIVNDAILQLSGYRFPDLVQTVFAAQPISTRFDDNRPGITLTQPSDVAQKGWGFGGGFLAGAAGTRVRTQFVPLAYFNGAVQTDANGNAEVSFTTPDNLTTWRVLAIALTADDRPRFASADATFITTKPLVTDPLLPQFARPGDRFEGGMLLMNAGSQTVDARTQALLSGSLSFASPAGSQSLQAQQQFGAGMNAWRFPMTVNGNGPATMQFTTTIGAAGSDAFRVPLNVRTADVDESTIEAGATRSSVSIPLTIGTSGGTVRIDAAASLIPQIAQPAKTALAQDDLALLSPVAARLSIAASVLAIQRKLGTSIAGVNAAAEGSKDVTQLAGMQRMDGGFAFWPHAGSSDLFATADAVRALAYASGNGIGVPGGMLAKAKPFLVRALADPAGIAKWCTSAACKASARLSMLRALASMGDRRTDFLQSIYDARERLGFPERVALALYLQRTPGWSAQAQSLGSQLAGSVYLTGRYANVQPQDVQYASLIEGQAAYLQLLAARGAPDADKDRALQALVAQQCKCGWPDLRDTAAALEAIVAYAGTQTAVPNFTAQVEVDGKSAGTAKFAGFSAPAHAFTLSNLSHGPHTITLRRTGAGTLHYVLAYTYALAPDAPGRISGLRARRTVRAVNTPTALATIDISPQPQPLTFGAGNVYDVAVQVITDHPVDRVVITDPLPAGFEAVDTSFLTTAAYYQPLSDDWQIDYQQIYRDRITAFAQHLDPGVYTFHYLARSVTPGEYLWPGTSAYLLNAPEQFGRAASVSVHVGS